MVVKRTQTITRVLINKTFQDLSLKEKDALLKLLFEKFGLIKKDEGNISRVMKGLAPISE